MGAVAWDATVLKVQFNLVEVQFVHGDARSQPIYNVHMSVQTHVVRMKIAESSSNGHFQLGIGVGCCIDIPTCLPDHILLSKM